MANVYYALSRGASGSKKSDFTIDTSSTSAAPIELRLADDANLTRQDVIIALNALKIAFESGGPAITTFPDL